MFFSMPLSWAKWDQGLEEQLECAFIYLACIFIASCDLFLAQVAKAIETVAAQSSAEKSDKPKDDPPKNSSDLKGIPQALLDRVSSQ